MLHRIIYCILPALYPSNYFGWNNKLVLNFVFIFGLRKQRIGKSYIINLGKGKKFFFCWGDPSVRVYATNKKKSKIFHLFVVLNPTWEIACIQFRSFKFKLFLLSQSTFIVEILVERIPVFQMYYKQFAQTSRVIRIWLHLTYKFSWETAVNQIINLNKPNVSWISCEHTQTQLDLTSLN